MSIESAARALIAAISPDSTGLRDAVDALNAALNTPPGFTVCLQEVGDTETTHVTYQACATRDEAVAAAIIACRADWEDAEDDDDPAAPRDLHVFAVFVGDVEVLEWEDQA